jgi:hypothetical protein
MVAPLDPYLLLLVHIQFTPSERPKGFEFSILHKYDIGVQPWSVTIENCQLTWENFVVHDVSFQD